MKRDYTEKDCIKARLYYMKRNYQKKNYTEKIIKGETI